MTGPDLALTRALLDEKFDRLRVRERTLLQSIVALDVFVGPQLLALLLGLSPAAVNTSLSKLKRAGLIRATPEGEVGITYRVLRDILPTSWRHPGSLEALRMAALLIEAGDWYAIARRAELYVLGGRLEDAVGEFERAGIEAQHRGSLKDASRLFALAAKTAKAAINDPDYVRDQSSDEDWLARTTARSKFCNSTTPSRRLRRCMPSGVTPRRSSTRGARSNSIRLPRQRASRPRSSKVRFRATTSRSPRSTPCSRRRPAI
jgi:DNA-binding transcriptional ArsR family regulator